MKIRASVLTPVLAVLTVAALIGTGIILGQERGQAVATLLGSTPDFAAAASANATVVAEAAPVGGPTDTWEQPAEETIPVIDAAPTGPSVTTEGAGASRAAVPTHRAAGGEAEEPTRSDKDSDESDEQAADPQHDEDDGSDDDESEDESDGGSQYEPDTEPEDDGPEDTPPPVEEEDD